MWLPIAEKRRCAQQSTATTNPTERKHTSPSRPLFDWGKLLVVEWEVRHRYTHLQMNDYKSPILSSVFNILGALVLGGAIVWVFLGIIMAGKSGSALSLIPAIGIALALVLTALIYFGVAQAIDYLGRTAHSTNRLCSLIETSIVRPIESIETRISASTPFRVRIDQPNEDKARYHYTAYGTQEGPFTAAEMRDFHESGVITKSTQVFREGESDWRTYKEYPDLGRL